jgi:putative transcriptional regulator
MFIIKMLVCKLSFTVRWCFIKNHIESFRKKVNFSQEQLATEVGVSRQTINSIENGRYQPSIELAFKLAHFFNVSIETLFIYEFVETNKSKSNKLKL